MLWFADEVVAKEWKVKDPWGEPAGVSLSPLSIAARQGSKLLVSALLARGANVNGDRGRSVSRCPGYAAFTAGRVDVFDLLLDAGMDVATPYADSQPLATRLFLAEWTPEDREKKMAMLRLLLAKRKEEVLGACFTGSDSEFAFDTLECAVRSRNVEAFDMLAEAGAKFRFREETRSQAGQLTC